MTCITASSLLLIWENGVCSPHGTWWVCAFGRSPCVNLRSVATVVILLVNHPLVVTNKIKGHLLKALLSDILD